MAVLQQIHPFVVKNYVLVKRNDIFVNFRQDMKYTLTAILLLATAVLGAQTALTIEGQTYTNSDEYWTGVVIPRSNPMTLIFKNNSIESVNLRGYMLQAGDDVASTTNNNLDGEVITGNKFIWEGNDMSCITHGLFTGNNVNALIKYNYLGYVPMGIIRKSSSNMGDSQGGIAYNIVKGGAVAINIKGISNIHIYNNTLYTDRTPSQTWRGLVYVYTNTDVTPNSVSHNTKIFNNIFYTKYQTYCIQVGDAEALAGFESDYNIFYCETGEPLFSYCGTKKTFSEWQALGYDTHSRVINPNFKDLVGFVPGERLNYGINLGSSWIEGLSVNAKWGIISPETALQNGPWQVGAVIYKEVTVPEPVQVPVYTGSVINDATPAKLEMTFSLTLANVLPATSSFSMSVNGSSRGVSAVSVSGTKVILTMSSPVSYGDRITVAYTKPSTNPLQTASGGQAASFSAQTVTNNLTAPVNSPPLINISSPTKSTAFISPATITIDASASDPDGTVTKVEFYNGTVKLGELTSAPWSYTWKEVKEGSYSITAAATDNSGSRTVSSAVTVVVEKSAPAVNLVPSVTIASPLNNGSFEAPATITFTVDASDPDGSITKVEYVARGVKIGESLVPPFAFTFHCDTAGIFEVSAIAWDNLNATATSSPVTISFSMKSLFPDLANLYPSPNNGVFAVEFNPLSDSVNGITLTILSLTGKVMFACQISEEETYKRIDITDAVPGIYIMQIADGNRTLTARRFIKY